jgi:hypothetical protein
MEERLSMKLRMKLRILSISMLCIFLSAFIAPIPLAQVTEQKSIYSESKDSLAENLIPSKPVEVNIHETYTVAEEVTTLDIVGSGRMVGDDMHASLSISIRTFNLRTSAVSLEISEREIVIPNYAEKRAQIIELDTNGDFAPAGDYGTFTKYKWYGWWHIMYPGSSVQAIDYDHADNYYTYYPEQWNQDWTQTHGDVSTIHYGKYQIDSVLVTGNIVPLLGPIATILAYTVAAILGVIIAILALLFLSIYLFTLWVVEAEQGDGWSYTLKQGSAKYISFGYWRDWWWRL